MDDLEREYVTMETLAAGNYIAVKKRDYDRIIFLTEIYGKATDIPAKETVNAIPIIEKHNRLFELSPTGAYMVPIKDIRLSSQMKSMFPEV